MTTAKSPIPIYSFGRHVLNIIDTGITKEWIETNGLGSYAMGTIVGANTRRYHGLFTVTSEPNLDRSVLVNRVEESALIRGHRADFSCQEYPGTISPQGHLFLESFNYEPFPRWTYSVDDLKIEKRFFLRSGEETAVVVYRHLIGPTVKLVLRPFLSCRNHAHILKEDNRFRNAIRFTDNQIHCSVQNQPEFYITAVGEPASVRDNIKIYADGYWYKNVLYAQDEEMEHDHQEDLYSPGQVIVELSEGQEVALVFSRKPPEPVSIEKWIDQELFIRSKVFEKMLTPPPFLRRCLLAADQFLIRTESGIRMITGYPWYDDTCRETLMSLPGICLATGRVEDAKSILEEASGLLRNGLLPAKFSSDPQNLAAYNNMDASFWYVWALQKYWETTKDLEFMRKMLPGVEDILRAFKSGITIHEPDNKLEIKMDADGLIQGASPNMPLTWMDAKDGDKMSTPRRGKPVEIQALWYNAIQFYCEIALKLGKSDDGWTDLAKKVRESFNQLFWNAQNNFLYDLIEGNKREGSIRPNALFAVSLPYEILDNDRFKPLMETAWRTLYTSLGLRTLAPAEPHFHGVIKGSERARMAAMHNGTVMPYLIGPFLTAFFKTYGRDQKTRGEAINFLRPFVSHLSDAGLGTVSEMFDGNPPFNPRGCVAESRGVAELLRVMKEEGLEF